MILSLKLHHFDAEFSFMFNCCSVELQEGEQVAREEKKIVKFHRNEIFFLNVKIMIKTME
jgi:hypothetical protein